MRFVTRKHINKIKALPRCLVLKTAVVVPAVSGAYQPQQRSGQMVNIVTVVASCAVVAGTQQVTLDCGQQQGYQVSVQGEDQRFTNVRKLSVASGDREPRVIDITF